MPSLTEKMPVRRSNRAYVPKRRSLPGSDEETDVGMGKGRHCGMCKQKHAPPTGKKCSKAQHNGSPKNKQQQEEGSQMKEIMARQLELMEVMAKTFSQVAAANSRQSLSPRRRPTRWSPRNKRKAPEMDESSDQTPYNRTRQPSSSRQSLSPRKRSARWSPQNKRKAPEMDKNSDQTPYTTRTKQPTSSRQSFSPRKRFTRWSPKNKRKAPEMDESSDQTISEEDTSLDEMDSNSSEDDVPTPHVLRTRYQQRVNKRAKQCGLIPEMKTQGRPTNSVSGRDRAVCKGKVLDMAWPHECLRRKQGKQLAYDELNIFEFIIGYTTIMEQQVPKLRKAMASHLQALCRDAGKFGWEATRDFHGIVLQEMELGHLTWLDQDEMNHLRADELWHVKPKEQKSSGKADKFCYAFQLGKCRHPGDHIGDKGLMYKHICGFCAKSGNAFRHTELECTKKLKEQENKEPNKEKSNKVSGSKN